MLDRTTPHIAIAGGGIGGLAVALALHQQGTPVRVYEKAAKLTEVGAGLSVWNNATHVLKALGLLNAAIAKGQVITQLVLKSEDGKVLNRTWVNQYATPALGMHRADLHTLLRQQLSPNRIQLNHTFQRRYEQVGQKVHVSSSRLLP
jgi:2-polyprenyl-6-methoxyphenol hydroxylase-like FAD-dependent oxidoreductase